MVENEISEQIHFFHLNRNSSGIVVKVDFDLTMTILAHNLYRLLASGLSGYSHNRAQSLYDTFIDNYGEVEVGRDVITIKMNPNALYHCCVKAFLCWMTPILGWGIKN